MPRKTLAGGALADGGQMAASMRPRPDAAENTGSSKIPDSLARLQ